MTNQQARVERRAILEYAVAWWARYGPGVIDVAPVGLRLHFAHKEDVELSARIAVACDDEKLCVRIDRITEILGHFQVPCINLLKGDIRLRPPYVVEPP